MDLKKFKNSIFEKAKQEGFSEFEIYFSSSKSLKISVFKGDVETFNNSENGGISFRGVFNNKLGYAYSEKVDISVIDEILKSAKENAIIIESSEIDEIFAGSESYPKLELFSQNLENVPVQTLIEQCVKMEKTALSLSDKISSCNYCFVGKGSSYIYIANSKGLELDKKQNYVYSYLNVIAKNEDDIKSGNAVFIGTDFSEFNVEKLAKEAVEKATNFLGAKSIPSGKYNIIFENEVFAELLSNFTSSFFGENVQKGFSLLKNKLNTKIASPLITIVEEPLKENSQASASFDSEGVACFDKTIVENGILKMFLYNLKSAKKDKTKSTGNGFKASFKGTVSTDVTNFFIKNGKTCKEDLIKSMEEGVLITEISGLHAGVNTISGDFSLLAQGFFIKNGKCQKPVEQITISGNFYNVLENVVYVCNDIKFLSSGIGSPSLYVEKLDIAGEK